MTSLASQLQTYTPVRSTCTMGDILGTLTAKDRAAVNDALADRTIPATHIAKVLTGSGHTVRGDTVRRHRNADCSCQAAAS